MAKIQKARIVVRELPGMEMGIEEQEGIIVELEEEVRRLRGVEEGIGRAAREAWQKGIGTEGGKEDEMEG